MLSRLRHPNLVMFLGACTGECLDMCVGILLYLCSRMLLQISFLGSFTGECRICPHNYTTMCVSLMRLLSLFLFFFPFFFAVKEPLIILNEYCSGGNLEDYLLQKRKGGRSSKPWIPPPKQVSVPVSCVCGCECWGRGWGCVPCLCLCRCCLRVRACA